MAKTIISVKNLSKKYTLGQKEAYYTFRDSFANIFKKTPKVKKSDFWALKDINFEVEEGEILGVIGKNGAGKSTILKILTQITPPTTGKINIHGRVSSLLEVGTGFHPELSGRENIYLNGAILGMKRAEIKKKFDEIVAFSEIGKFLDTPVKRYSSGMYVRLAFAVAAHLDPEILIVDEVLAVGDVAFQKKCLGKMGEIARGGKTVLFVSHNLSAISNLCTRAIQLDKGQIKFIGKVDKCISMYLAETKSNQGRVEWDKKNAPGNNNVKLKHVKIISGNNISDNVMINKDTIIEIAYWNFKPNAQLMTSIHLKDSLGSYVLASVNLPSASTIRDKWYGKARPVGLYKTICVIPANFLNDIQYSLDIGLANSKNEFEFNLEDLISFKVIDSGEMRKEYMGDWIGAVRPKLLWKTELIDKN